LFLPLPSICELLQLRFELMGESHKEDGNSSLTWDFLVDLRERFTHDLQKLSAASHRHYKPYADNYDEVK